jgi:hypothetical protein
MSAEPLNIQEFNTITGLIFAQLHKAFPGAEDIDRTGIAKAMGVAGDDWSKHMLPSGRSFDKVLAYTIGWLNAEEYMKAYGAHPSQNVMLTTKGLAATNAVPSGLKESHWRLDGRRLRRLRQKHRQRLIQIDDRQRV